MMEKPFRLHYYCFISFWF